MTNKQTRDKIVKKLDEALTVIKTTPRADGLIEGPELNKAISHITSAIAELYRLNL